MRRASAILFLVLLPLAAEARQEYLPLTPGNSWTFFRVTEPADTARFGPFTIAGGPVINGNQYVVFQHSGSLADTLRDTGNGQIMAYRHGEEAVLYDFTLPDSATYHYTHYGETVMPYTVEVLRNQAVNTHAGHFEGCIRLFFMAEDALDEDRVFLFAPDVGLVGLTIGQEEDMRLYEAEVDDRRITSAADVSLPDVTPRLTAFPNPASEHVYFSVDGGLLPPLTIRILDTAGRLVTTLSASGFGRPAELYWDTTGVPAGVYFAVLEGTDASAAVQIVIQ